MAEKHSAICCEKLVFVTEKHKEIARLTERNDISVWRANYGNVLLLIMQVEKRGLSQTQIFKYKYKILFKYKVCITEQKKQVEVQCDKICMETGVAKLTQINRQTNTAHK